MLIYWRKKQVDFWAGVMCATGFFLGGYYGSAIAIHLDSRNLKGAFGVFVIFSGIMLWVKSRLPRLEKNTIA
jgi:uncharacterized membrane protein YfcA